VALMASLLEQVEGSGLFDELQALEKYIRRYDFGSALENLQVLMKRWQVS
jgi:hypothetical protein